MRRAGAALVLALLGAVPGGACANDENARDEVDSPCRAFAPAPQPRWELTSLANLTDVRQVVASTSNAYALDGVGKLSLLAGSAPTLAIDLGASVRAVAVARDGSALHVLRGSAALEVVRYASNNGGVTFDPAGAVPLSLATEAPLPDGGALAVDSTDGLWVATPDGTTSRAQDPESRLGKVLRIANGSAITVVARGLRAPSAIDVDPDLGDVWLIDARVNGAEIDRVLDGASYGWPVLDGLACTAVGNACERDGHVPPVAVVETSVRGAAVARGAVGPLAGKLVIAGTELAALAPYGPSGPAAISMLSMAARTVARGPAGALLVATESGVARVNDIPSVAPATLLATGCFDLAAPGGVPAGGIGYAVASPLWSDGADKSRFVVIPKGQRGRALADGDLRLPVGTVAVKTFSVGGKKVETRLFVQHELESWTGYSYMWNDAETDAELVSGNREKALSSGQRWYFPSSDDCNACHTPAAGYTLGLEARQLTGQPEVLAAIDRKLLAPIDRTSHPPLASVSSQDRPIEERARGYLHANCSMCHRDGSATGLAELDLRVDVPLDRTGLCTPPKAGSFAIADARVIAPGDPARSVLLHRMKALGAEARMPKLASHVIDAEGVALIERWIGGLGSCP